MKKASILVLSSLMILTLMITASCQNQQTTKCSNGSVWDLSVSEHFSNPLGFYDAAPTFSWKLPVCNSISAQSAYHIKAASSVDLLDSEPGYMGYRQSRVK